MVTTRIEQDEEKREQLVKLLTKRIEKIEKEPRYWENGNFRVWYKKSQPAN